MIVVIASFLAGLAGQRLLPRPVATAALLDRFVLGVALPALILAKLPDVPLGAAMVVPVAVAWGGLGVAAVTIAGVARLRGWKTEVTAALLLVTPLGNTSFLGLPMVEALLGGDRLGPALAFDQLGSFLGLILYGGWVASRYGNETGGWRAGLRRLLRFAPFVALLASIPLRWVELPGLVDDALTVLGRLVAPAALAALALRLRLSLPRRLLEPAAWCLATKMILLPALAMAVAAALGERSDPVWDASVVQLGMPPMVTAAVIATRAGFDSELATLAVGAGIVAAFVTLPAVTLLLGRSLPFP